MAYEIAINSKYNGYLRGVASMVQTFFVKKTGSGAKARIKVGASVNEELAQELQKPMI